MKRNLKKILSLAVLAVLALTVMLTSCQPTVDTEGTATLVVANDSGVYTFEIPLGELVEAKSAVAALDYLKGKGELDYTSAESTFGAYLTKVGHIVENGDAGIYVGIWTSVAKDADTSDYATTKIYNGTTLTASGVGISQMSLTDGCIIYIGEIIYN